MYSCESGMPLIKGGFPVITAAVPLNNIFDIKAPKYTHNIMLDSLERYILYHATPTPIVLSNDISINLNLNIKINE